MRTKGLTNVPNSDEAGDVLQLKISLKGSKPLIWRRILMESSHTLEDLHFAVQTAMGWDNSHLHVFEVGRREYGPVYEDGETDMDWEDEADCTLGQVLKKVKQKILYRYDFGDDWEHEIVFEKRMTSGTTLECPVCTGGEMACPPEDSGGLYGYYNKLEVLQHPEHEYFKEISEWMGEDWDPEYFSVDETNEALAMRFTADTDDLVEAMIEEGILAPEDAEDPGRVIAALLDVDPFLEEAMDRSLKKLKSAMGFKDKMEALEYIAGLSPGKVIELGKKYLMNNPIEHAHQLALLAMQAEDIEEACSMARSALDLDPENSDAQLTLLRYEVDSPEESLERYRQICESAAQRLGPEFIQANRGRFGEIAETRPYLRARLCLATSLLQEGHTEEAIEHMREMLDLDEEDSHGIRFILLGTFLMTRQLEDAAALFRRFPKETGDTFLWGRVLERFLRGDVTGAGKALAKARRQSDELEPYFTGDVYLDDPDADDELDDDRVIYELGPAWEAHPDAVAWLRSKAPCQ